MWLYLLLAAIAYTTIWYIVSMFLKRADIMDVAWGMGFILLAWIWHCSIFPLPYLFLFLLTLHQMRLSVHIGYRMCQKAEDKRYGAWRRNWGNTFWWRSYLQIFLLQGTIIAIVLGSLIMGTPLIQGPFILVASCIFWLYGMVYEVLGDWQLLQFKANKQSQKSVLNTGLWARTRHPNYWGECCIWWSYWFLLGAPLMGVIAPLLMTFLLVRVSGVTMTERAMKSSPEYEVYKKSVPPFVPTKHFF